MVWTSAYAAAELRRIQVGVDRSMEPLIFINHQMRHFECLHAIYKRREHREDPVIYGSTPFVRLGVDGESWISRGSYTPGTAGGEVDFRPLAEPDRGS